jgi:hypothetical protein
MEKKRCQKEMLFHGRCYLSSTYLVDCIKQKCIYWIDDKKRKPKNETKKT